MDERRELRQHRLVALSPGDEQTREVGRFLNGLILVDPSMPVFFRASRLPTRGGESVANTWRIVVTLAVVVMVAGPAGVAAAEQPSTPLRRVRTSDSRLAALLDEALARSATFRTLVDGINQTDGLVLIEYGRCRYGLRACLPLTLTQAGPYRLLRIVVDSRRADRDLMAALGHELAHAYEVLSDPTVTSKAALYFLFKRIGSRSGDRFETKAAIRAGNAVRAELRR
jgi:hypothetical protein